MYLFDDSKNEQTQKAQIRKNQAGGCIKNTAGQPIQRFTTQFYIPTDNYPVITLTGNTGVVGRLIRYSSSTIYWNKFRQPERSELIPILWNLNPDTWYTLYDPNASTKGQEKCNVNIYIWESDLRAINEEVQSRWLTAEALGFFDFAKSAGQADLEDYFVDLGPGTLLAAELGVDSNDVRIHVHCNPFTRSFHHMHYKIYGDKGYAQIADSGVVQGMLGQPLIDEILKRVAIAAAKNVMSRQIDEHVKISKLQELLGGITGQEHHRVENMIKELRESKSKK